MYTHPSSSVFTSSLLQPLLSEFSFHDTSALEIEVVPFQIPIVRQDPVQLFSQPRQRRTTPHFRSMRNSVPLLRRDTRDRTQETRHEDQIFSTLQSLLNIVDNMMDIDQDVYELSMQSYYDNEIFRHERTRQLECPEVSYQSISNAQDSRCNICLEDFKPSDSVGVLPCHHIYHYECLQNAIQYNHSQCPMCRTTIPSHMIKHST